MARAGAGGPGGVGDRGGWRPGGSRACGWTPRSCWVEAEIAAGHARRCWSARGRWWPQAPFRERRWALLATALHHAGRQPEALGALKRRAGDAGRASSAWTPGPSSCELEQLLLRQDPSLSRPEVREASAVCPYRGLLPYGAEDADTFFGREDDVAACLTAAARLPACSPWSGRPASASPRWSGPGWWRRLTRERHPGARDHARRHIRWTRWAG